MPITDLTGTYWKINATPTISTNTAYDIDFSTNTDDYGLFQLSNDILFDNSVAYGEEVSYTTIDSTVTLSGNVTANYRIVSGGTLNGQGYTVTGNIILDGGTLKYVTITGKTALLSGNRIDGCDFQGPTHIEASINIADTAFSNRLNIINVSDISLSNCAIQPNTTGDSVLNIINSNLTLRESAIYITSTSALVYNKMVIKNSQVVFDNVLVSGDTQFNLQNCVVENSALTLTGDNMTIQSTVPPFNIIASDNITIARGTYMWNPSNYSYITIPSECYVETMTVSGITLYRVKKLVPSGGNFD